jgi:hypothetical protein
MVKYVALRSIIGKISYIQTGGQNLHRRSRAIPRNPRGRCSAITMALLARGRSGRPASHPKQFLNETPETTCTRAAIAAGSTPSSAEAVMAAVASFMGSASGAGSVSCVVTHRLMCGGKIVSERTNRALSARSTKDGSCLDGLPQSLP